MTDDRVCTKCGKGGLPPRCRVHDECLSSASGTSARTTNAAGFELPLKWWDDDREVFRWAEPVWMTATCGASVYTIETVGAPHEDCDDDCRLVHISAEQPVVTADIDWSTVDMQKVLPEAPSTFEHGFPEIYFRPRGKSLDPDDEGPERVPAERRRLLEEIDEMSAWLPADVVDACYDGLEHRARTPQDADRVLSIVYARICAAMDREHGLVAS